MSVRVTVDGKQLKEAILWGIKGVSRNLGESASGAQAVLAFAGNTLTVKSASGDSHFFTATINASGLGPDEGEEVRVYGPTLGAAANALDNEPTAIEITDKEIILIMPRSRFAVPRSTVRSPRFPEIPPVVGTVTFGDFKKAANAALSLAKPSPAVPVLETVMLQPRPENNRLRMQSTDRLSLFVQDLPYAPEIVTPTQDAEDEGPATSLVPAVMLKTLLGGLPGNPEDIQLHGDGRYFGISTANFSGYVGVLQAQPMDVTALMSVEKMLPRAVVVGSADLNKALTKVVPMLNEDRVHLDITATSITVCSPNGQAKTEVNAEVVKGISEEDPDEVYTIKFNPTVLQPLLNKTSTPKITLMYGLPNKPVIVRDNNADDTVAQDLFLMGMPLKD